MQTCLDVHIVNSPLWVRCLRRPLLSHELEDHFLWSAGCLTGGIQRRLLQSVTLFLRFMDCVAGYICCGVSQVLGTAQSSSTSFREGSDNVALLSAVASPDLPLVWASGSRR